MVQDRDGQRGLSQASVQGGNNYSRGLAHLADCLKQTFPPKDAGREDVEREGWGQ